jgi:predicted outer membrane repeat protein
VFSREASGLNVTATVFGNNAANQHGGGMYVERVDNGEFVECLFAGNYTDAGGSATSCHGGGLYINSADITTVMQRCTWIGNFAEQNGGGMYLIYADPSIVNCLFAENLAGNTGGALYSTSYSNPDIEYCTFAYNSASNYAAISATSTATPLVANSIVAGQGMVPVTLVSPGAAVSYSNIEDQLFPGDGNISVDPYFANSGPDDYRLQFTSMCIGSADPTSIVTVDLDGNPRPFGALRDMGAYEFQGCPSFDSQVPCETSGCSWDGATCSDP